MIVVSKCCNRPIIVGYKHEYPLGGSVWRETFKVDICESCGRETTEYVEQCEVCGELECYECESTSCMD